MYLQGVSTRKVAKVMKELCGGNGVSATYVSQCCAQLDTLFEKWRNRPIPPIAHLFLDATYTKVRRNDTEKSLRCRKFASISRSDVIILVF